MAAVFVVVVAIVQCVKLNLFDHIFLKFSNKIRFFRASSNLFFRIFEKKTSQCTLHSVLTTTTANTTNKKSCLLA